MSTISTILAVGDAAFLMLDIYDRVKGDPEQEDRLAKLKEYWTKVKDGEVDDVMKAEIDAMVDDLIAQRRKAVQDVLDS